MKITRRVQLPTGTICTEIETQQVGGHAYYYPDGLARDLPRNYWGRVLGVEELGVLDVLDEASE